MDWDDVSPLFAIAAIAAFVIALRASVVARELRLRLTALGEHFTLLDRRVEALGERLDRFAPLSDAAATESGAAPAAPAAAAEPAAPPTPDVAPAAAEPPPEPQPQ